MLHLGPIPLLRLLYAATGSLFQLSALSSCVINFTRGLTGHNLRCDFWYILHEEVHGLASSATNAIWVISAFNHNSHKVQIGVI